MDKEDLYDSIGEYSALLKKYFDGRLSAEERRRLARWLWSDRKNRFLLDRLRSASRLKSYYHTFQSIDPEEEYKQLTARCSGTQGRGTHFILYRRWVAAVVLVVVGTATWFLLRTTDTKGFQQSLTDGKYMAVLKTSDGGVFRLGELNGQQPDLQQKGLQLRDSMKELICAATAKSDSLIYHRLEIPPGGEYKLILADGTKVWLNSQSMIRFPLSFGKQCREIEISGEVYLEVHKESNRPFRIKAGAGKVEVLGTSFGMNVYPDEQTWTTTLVEGSIRVDIGNQDLILKPGEMAYVEDGRLNQKEVDTDKELAWTRGEFVFEHDALEDVVKKLSRWYAVEFRFAQEELKQYVFTGQVSRDMGVDQILDLIERMNVVSFEKKGNYFFIKEKAGDD